MNKTFSLILRVVVALLGLMYIAWIIDWTDRVELAPGTYQTNQGVDVTLEKKAGFRIVSGDFDPRKVAGTLTVAVEPPYAELGSRLDIRPDQFAGESPRFTLRPGIITTLRHAKVRLLLLGWIIIAPIFPITALRWWLLLRVRGINVTPWRAFRLTMVGCFFNYCMPGSTGGDVVKAFYAARSSDRRADAVMTVIIDRIVGLLGLFVLAGIAGLFIHHDPSVHKVTLFVWVVAAGVVVVSALYFSRRLRQATGLDWLLARLLKKDSLLGKVDAAAVAYSYHKPTVLSSILLSLPVQILLAISTSLAGWALGMTTPFPKLLAVVPMVFLVMSIPISPQGVGTGEFVALKLLQQASFATANQVIVMLMVARLYQLVYALSGAVFLLKGDIHLHPAPGSADSAGTDDHDAAADGDDDSDDLPIRMRS